MSRIESIDPFDLLMRLGLGKSSAMDMGSWFSGTHITGRLVNS